MVNSKQYEFTSVYKHTKTALFHQLMRCAILLFSIISIMTSASYAQDIGIGLMDRKTVSSLLFSPTSSKYVLLNEERDTIYVFKSDDAIAVSIIGDQLLVKSPYGLNDTVSTVQLVGSGNSPNFRVRFNDEKRDHSYFDKLSISVSEGNLKMVNGVSVERYVARVVQSEVGSGAAEEYYKIQSIICRTYAVRNLERHALSGFDLCDHEHCQVYSGMKPATHEVLKATSATSGLVMVDGKNELILSAFHANCGGQTSNSEDVWRESRSYLTSVEDTFCLKGRSAVWDKTMPLDEFITQLGFKTDTVGFENWSYDQTDRKKYFVMRSDSLETAQMRRLLQLRSTYFDVNVKNGTVELKGRGFGHGVGLCQQGAMKMAENGYTYSQILGYYYKGVSLTPFTALQPEK